MKLKVIFAVVLTSFIGILVYSNLESVSDNSSSGFNSCLDNLNDNCLKSFDSESHIPQEIIVSSIDPEIPEQRVVDSNKASHEHGSKQSELNEVKNEFSNEESDGLLDAKRAWDEEQGRLEAEKLDAKAIEENSTYREENFRDIQEANSLAIESKWDEFQDLTDQTSAREKEVLTLFLIQAILHNAPTEVVVDLLNNGAQLNSFVLVTLSKSNNLRLMKLLGKYGLDIHMRDNRGRSALYYSMFNAPKSDVFDFLLSNGLSPNSNTPGTDPLDKALSLCLQGSQASYFANKLVSYGADIERSHIELVAQIRNSNVLCSSLLRPPLVSN